jgi:hypothetical protein
MALSRDSQVALKGIIQARKTSLKSKKFLRLPIVMAKVALLDLKWNPT